LTVVFFKILKNEALTAFRGQHHGLNLNLILELELKKCQLLLLV